MIISDTIALTAISLNDLAGRIDLHADEVDQASVEKILTFVDGLSSIERGQISLDAIDRLDIDVRFKDLAVLGLILSGTHAITPEQLGANLKSTLEKIPEAKQRLEDILEAHQNQEYSRFRALPNDFSVVKCNEAAKTERYALEDEPVGFTIHDGYATLAVRRPNREGDVLVEGLHRTTASGAGNPEPRTYQVSLREVDSHFLKQSLAKLPKPVETNSAVAGLFAIRGDPRKLELRSIIEKELEGRNKGGPMLDLKATVESIAKPHRKTTPETP